MPTAVAGISIGEATRILQIQNRMLHQFPEVDVVFGKVGQSETSTDPAPISMVETVVKLKPPDQWRPGMTWEKLLAEMNDKIKTPGMANIFWMPIQTRTEMLTTGFRSILGIKVFGPDLGVIQDIGVQIEKTLSDFPDTRSVFAERTTGGYFLDITPNRQAAARYGLTVGDINEIVETAIGGKTIATTVEGRERYPISVRYARDFRDDLDALKRVLVPVPMSGEGSAARPTATTGMSGTRQGASSMAAGAQTMAQIPLSMLADISYKTGPPSIRNENGQLVGFVFVDITSDNIQGYVDAAAKRINEAVKFPPGYYIQWAGQFEYLKSAEKRLKIVVPFTLLIIFVLIYINTKSAVKTFIVLLAVPFSLVGAFWLLYLLGYNMSVAVWVGLIALAGLDAETGVVMLLYLDHAWDKFRSLGRMNTMGDLHAAVIEGAVQRIRPKIMTICAILFGLLPIMWSPTTQSGADVMKRIAAPMIGGVVTSGVLELLIYPVIFVLWRKRYLPRDTRASMERTAAPAAPAITPAVLESAPATRPGRRRRVLVTAAVLVLIAAGAWLAWQKFGPLTGHMATTASAHQPQVEISEAQKDAMQKFFAAADAISASLAADDLAKFNDAASKVGPATEEMGRAFDAPHPWQALVRQVRAVALLPQARSLEDARKSFYPFTERVTALAKAVRVQNQAFASLKVYRCPMAPKAGQISYWLQLQGPLRNPFYGGDMLDCGSEVPRSQ